MSGTCPTLVGVSSATNTVENGWSFYSNKADELIDLATAAADDLANLDLATTSISDVALDLPEDITLPGPLSDPAEPDLSSIDTAYDEKPGAPNVTAGGAKAIPVPSFNELPPDVTLPAQPTKPSYTMPTAPALPDRDMPAYVEKTEPTLPSFRDLNIPIIADLNLPAWTRTAPDATGLVPPGDTFSYSDTAFSLDTVDNVQAKLNTWLTGSERLGMADTIWDQLWGEQRTRELEAYQREVGEINRNWNQRGFSSMMPVGPRDAAIRAAVRKQLMTESELGRKITTEAAKMEVDQLRFAVERGISLTQVLSQVHNAEMDRAFAIAQYTFQSGLEIFNANVAFYDVKLKGYQIEATVWLNQIQGEVAKLEVTRLKLEAEKAKGEANKNDLDLYLGQWEGIKNHIDAYTAQVNSVTAALEGDRTKLQLYSEKLNGIATQAKIYVSEVDAFRTIASVNEIETKAFESAVRAHLGQIEGVKVQNDVAIANAKLVNEAAGINADIYKTKMGGWSEGLRAQSDQLRAQADIFDGRTRLYDANSRHQSNQVNAQVARYNAAVEGAKASADIAVKRIELDLGQVSRIQSLEVNGKQVAANLYGQLGAATMSAVNLGATISANDADSRSCSTSYTYSY